MKFSEDEKIAKYLISSYDEVSLTINGEIYQESVIISPSAEPIIWNLTDATKIQPIELAPLLRLQPEVLIIGQEGPFKVTNTELVAALINAKISYEFMNINAAIRSYNLLANDYRHVVLGIVRAR